MKKFLALMLLSTVLTSSCVKLEELEGNNVEYEITEFELEEKITLIIPNSEFSWIPNLINCMDISLIGGVNFESFVPTQNPNPYAHLVYEIRPKAIIMELTNITDCDFGMLENVEVFLTDSSVTDPSQFILQDPNNLSAPHNAVKIGELMTIEDGSNIINLVVNQNAVLDQFIHNQSFNTYANMNLDKAFTQDEAIIKTSILMSVKLINDN
ncbi:hypothetical protein [uncultured Flavobacterium sp.]|jgi:hypothetical protein|uniref:hypothetical protein n=1 Tax=uncultured Flavobacterium sp. TaxID=165435 RepID=UPI0030CA5668